MSELLIIIIVIGFLVLILTFLLSFVVKRTNVLMKDIFIDKVSEFDYLIGDKERKVDELNEDIKKKSKEISDLEAESQKYNGNNNNSSNEVVLPKYTDFEDGNIFSNYKIIKEKFNYNIKDILTNFIAQNKQERNDDYELFCRMRGYFTFDVIYKLSLYQNNEQFDIVMDLLDDKEKKLLTKEFNEDNFDLRKVVDYLDENVIKTSPVIRVLVPNENDNYDSLDNSIVTMYDDKITEGFKIIYKGVIYDYSI